METWHIHIKGQIQGVGFRPFIYLLAKQANVKGWVINDVDGVHIECNATPQKVRDFLQAILENPPPLAHILAYELREIAAKKFSKFEIKKSQHKGKPNLLLTPDAAICVACTKELFETSNRRATYPFITCTNCGPRYSIIRQLPYDRSHTNMKDFQMCDNCQAEYTDANNRRYYSQTNSCFECSIQLELFDAQRQIISTNATEMIDLVCSYWQAGKIVAIKGIGGYLLTCDASNESSVQLLRKRKQRLTKPFAVLFPTVERLEKELELEEKARLLLHSTAAPIVLLMQKNAPNMAVGSEPLAPSIAPELTQIGAMLPYTPLYHLLLKQFNKPIIATSGNKHNSPILYEEDQALTELATIADFTVSNNRKIVVPQDDSVVKFTFFKQQKILLRRSRGYAPTYISPSLNFSSETVLAMGSKMKSTFTLAYQGNVFISQYLGDLDNFYTQENYQHILQHFLELFQTQPEIILFDKHSGYPSSILGREMAAQLGIPTTAIQHHEAHFAAVLAEHNLIKNTSPILGVVWDGTGIGEDGHIWGGEFFIYQNYQFQRSHHLDYVDFIVGDKMAKEPRISALSFCWGIPKAMPYLKPQFTTVEWLVYNKLLAKGSPLKTASIGRLFDAVAALLGILDKQTYEGEAALLLETKATLYFQENGLNTFFSSYDENKGNFRFKTKDFLNILITDLNRGASIAFIAAHFHYLLVKYIEQEAILQSVQQIAFSGGVFQNGLLVDLLIHHLEGTFNLYFHKAISPNDENISFGQLAWYEIAKKNKHEIP